MKEQIKTPLLIAAIVVIVAIVGYFGYKSISSVGQLDNGQIKYTPGKPPWMESDASKRGPGGSPGVASGALRGGTQTAPPEAPNMPVGPPVVNNGK